jgi:hypothetical protein
MLAEKEHKILTEPFCCVLLSKLFYDDGELIENVSSL